MAWQLVYTTVTPEWYTYVGGGDVCVAVYEGITTGEALATSTIQEVRNNGGTPLSVRVWKDGSQWMVETTAHGSPFDPATWAFIIFAVLAILALAYVIIWGMRYVSEGLTKFVHGYPPYIDAEGNVTYPPSAWESIGKVVMWTAIGAIGILVATKVPWGEIAKRKKL